MFSNYKCSFILLLILALLLPLVSLGETQEEWDAAHPWKILKDTDLYSEDSTKKKCGTIAKDTHVNFVTADDKFAVIDYLNEDEEIERAYVLRSMLTNTLADIGLIFTADGSVKTGKSSSSSKALNPTSSPKNTVQEENAEEEPEDESSDELIEFKEVTPFIPDEDGTLALIYAPNSGKATLRSEGKKKAEAICDCAAGMLVTVLEKGDSFSLIRYDGQEGYVLSSCLKACDPASDDTPIGYLVLDGKAEGEKTINIRLNADRGSYKIAVIRTGTQVLVLEKAKNWTSIEVNGMRGFVQNQYLEMDE